MGTLGECRTGIFTKETIITEFGGSSGGPKDSRIGKDPRNDDAADSHVAQSVIEKTGREPARGELVHHEVRITGT